MLQRALVQVIIISIAQEELNAKEEWQTENLSWSSKKKKEKEKEKEMDMITQRVIKLFSTERKKVTGANAKAR